MTSPLPIVATTLRFAYSETEDRISLLASDVQRNGVHVALTRRLTDRLVNGLAHLLEQSSPIAKMAHADLRDDIILLEHQDALYGEGQGASSEVTSEEAGHSTSLPMPRLVHAIDVTITPQTFELLLREAQTLLIRLSLNRLQVHRIIEALSKRAQAAGWNLSVEAAWLEPGQTQIVFN